MSDPVVGSEKDRTMQVMFFRQHFGQLALGMASVDEAIKEHQKSLNHDGISENFFSITRGGLSTHPWADNRYYERQIAIVGTGLIDNLDAEPCLYAMYRHRAYGVMKWLGHNTFERPASLPSPRQLAEDVTWNAKETKTEPKGDWWQWRLLDRNVIPIKQRRLLDKVMDRIDDALGQGPHFFEKARSR